ncbi:MAG TPA: type VI secretion system accessory protein TagJ [Gemmataceae bacterium]
MTARELFQEGRLGEALEAQRRVAARAHSDPRELAFLADLLAFAGRLPAARRAAAKLPADDPDWAPVRVQYQGLLAAERRRRELFAGRPPRFFAEPPEHVRLTRRALARLRRGDVVGALDLLDRAQELAPELQGHLNGREFEGLRDSDDVFAHVLEVFLAGRYFWVPFEQLRRVTFRPPYSPRDLLYVPAVLKLRDGTEGEVFVPALYPGSHAAADDALRLGRATDWTSPDGGPVRGVGQRVFLIGGAEVPISEVRQIELSAPRLRLGTLG